MTGSLATGVVASPHAIGFVDDASDANTTQRSDQRPGFQARLNAALLPLAHSVISLARPDLPSTYVVQSGDSVSGIADRFNIPTPAVLTLNGLSWNATLHEGQVLKLTADPSKKRAASPARLSADGYNVKPGESASTIAERLGISTAALLEHNDLNPDAVIFAGQYLKIPGATTETVSRVAPSTTPVVAPAAGIVAASTSNSPAPESMESSAEQPPIFDAADIEQVETPALITVRVPDKAAAPSAPKVVAEEKKPAPVAQASAPPPPQAEAPSSVGQPVTGTITPLNDERRANAQIIVAIGRELGVPDYGIVIALATAMQESSLRNINWGDRDSVGLYQQRPSAGWGTAEQIMDQAYATRLFFGGPSNPNSGKTRGLLDIAGWQGMALTVAAQRVQISAYPDAYAKWEPSAWAWLYELS
jgi:LysM repeat protein